MQTGWHNLPYGANDDSLEIGGLTIDRDATYFCYHCQRITEGLEQGHPSVGLWFWCSECDLTTELPDMEPDIDERF